MNLNLKEACIIILRMEKSMILQHIYDTKGGRETDYI